jgi:hypothetical protein
VEIEHSSLKGSELGISSQNAEELILGSWMELC